MNIIPIEIVDDIYSCSKGMLIKWHSVKFPELNHFAVSLDKLIGELGESAKDDFWTPVCRRLKRIRFDFCAAPLNDQILQSYLSELIPFLRDKTEACKLIYPNASRQFAHLLSQVEILSKVKSDILLTYLNEILDKNHKETALLIREPRLVPSVELSLSSYSNLLKVTVVNPTMLREETCFKLLVVIGPSRWYPEYVFSAPRASKIMVIKYSWITDQWKQESVFTEPVKERANTKQEIIHDEAEEDSPISPEDLLPPSFDFQSIANQATGELGSNGEDDYSIDARVFVLEDGWAVFLEADESTSVVVINLESNLIKPVRRIKIGEIKPGVFVLLRTGGGGDYIVPIADRIMGENALVAREFQKEWKTHLRNKVRRYGYEFIIAQLKHNGSLRANHMNIHNWMSERSIKPEFIEDFRAIMRLVELDQETEYYWEMMRLIDRAHLKAGMQIRRMLLEQVRECDLSILKRTGRMEFTLPGEQSVSITAFQVKDISPSVVSVAPWRIGNPFELDE